jgi:membrane protease YdiL (CAAX protease family)
LIALGLVPGALATLVYVLLSGPVETAGLPPAFGLLAAILLVIIPFELGVVVRASRRDNPGKGALASVPYRVPMSRREWLVLAPALLLVSIVGFGVVGAIEPPIRDTLFGWLPDWFRDPLPVDAVATYSSAAWTITLIGYFALNVVAGPIVEELYFRGYLLPRMSRYGRWAPLLNAMLFSLYHFWSPWQFLSRVAGVTPFAYGVWWKRNVYLGMVVHMSLNAIGTATIAVLVLQRMA